MQPAWVSTRPALWTSRGNRRIFLQRQVRADFFTVFDSRGSLDRRVIGWICSALIRQMDVDNPLWGAPRIHGKLLKLGFEVAPSSAAKYMTKRPPSALQGWLTFLRNHPTPIATMDLLAVPSVTFELLYAFIIVRLARNDLIWINATSHPIAEWITYQITEAFPWNEVHIT